MCISKKESQSGVQGKPIATEIELHFPQDKESTFFNTPGSTPLRFITIESDNAALFSVGESYKLTLSAL